MKRYLYTIFYIIFFFNSALTEIIINPIQEGNPDAKIKLIVYDFDGVMTDNKVYLNEDGKESVRVNRADGLAISEIKSVSVALPRQVTFKILEQSCIP